jgi:hypothetical protein
VGDTSTQITYGLAEGETLLRIDSSDLSVWVTRDPPVTASSVPESDVAVPRW